MNNSERGEGTTDKGEWYQYTVHAFWDDRPDQEIRVICSVDDGGWRAFLPVSSDFIMNVDGTFVGE